MKPAARTGESRPHPLAPWRATAVLFCVLLLGAGILFLVQHGPQRVSVDPLDLLPRDEQDPTIRLARQTVSGRLGRVLYIAVSDQGHPDKAPVPAAALIARELRAQSGTFSNVFSGLDDASKERLETWFFAHRLEMRLPIWFDGMTQKWRQEKSATAATEPDTAWLAQQAAASLQAFQSSDDALAYQDHLPADPLLLIPGLLATFGDEDKSTASSVQGGALTKTGADGTQYALIQAETRGNQMEESGQTPVFAALDKALADARQKFGGGITLKFSGVNKFAADMREHGMREISLLTWISLGLSFVLLFAAFRRVTVFIYLLLPIATATVWSLVICFALFAQVHVVAITFVTVLVGVALDYGIYALIHARESAGGLAQALREIRWPLIAGCLTSVGGFIFMTLTNLPMLQQMGLAVALGLIFALALDFCYLPWIPALRAKPAGENTGRLLDLSGARFPGVVLIALVAAGALVVAAHLQWSDDIRTLNAVSPQLQDEQTFLRQLFGQGGKRNIVLTFGNNLDTAYANLSKFNALIGTVAVGGGSDHYLNLGKLLPSQSQSAACAEYFRAHPNFADDLRTALAHDFNADAFAPFWEDWRAWQETNLAQTGAPPPIGKLLGGLREVLPLPLQFLWSDEQPGAAWFATTLSDSLFQKLPPAALNPPNTYVDQTKTINAALRRYRLTAAQRAGIGLALISVAVLLAYGWRRALFMLAIPALSILGALAVLGFLGQQLGLLHVVALLLGFCLASDYSIFLGSPGELPRSTHRAVVLAASTALLSFAVLSFSHIEALRNICLTVTLVIGFVLLLCELSYRWLVRATTVAAVAG